MWDLATDRVGWVGAACRATMIGHMHTVRCLQVSTAAMLDSDSVSYLLSSLSLSGDTLMLYCAYSLIMRRLCQALKTPPLR